MASLLTGPVADNWPTGGLPSVLRDTARRCADLTAVSADQGNITYGQLMSTVNALAAELNGLDQDRNDPVVLFMPSGPCVVAALWACLTSGRPFLPLEITEPDSRLAAMVSVAKPSTVMVAESSAPLPPALAAMHRVVVGDYMDAPPASEPHADIDPSTPAYILFTSGSTGTPKGVRVSHGAIANRILYGQSEIPLTEDDIVLMRTSYTFDASFLELMWPFVVGARVHVLPDPSRPDPVETTRVICQEKVTVLYLPPSMLEVFLRFPKAAECRSLRHVLAGGEALLPGLVQLFGRTLKARLHNLYGPTETAITVAHWHATDPLTCDRVFIGEPIANVTARIMDSSLRLVPDGEAGELCISGVQLADGYVGDRQATEKAFPSLPDGTRIYRTGDRVRVTDGLLEYVGRVDDQVQIRGIRVEPGEVETKLRAHESVADVAVVQRKRKSRTELVAFVQPKAPPTAAAGERTGPADPWWTDPELARALRSFLAAELPPAYIPVQFLFLARFPVLISGKKDRSGLRRLAEQAGPDAAAGGPAGDTLARAWAAALDLDSAQDDRGFIDLGGDSLRAARLISVIVTDHGLHVPLQWLVSGNPSLRELRERLRDAAAGTGEAGIEESDATGAPGRDGGTRAPLSPTQRRLWLLEHIQGSISEYNIVSAVTVPAVLDEGRLHEALRGLMGRHAALRVGIGHATAAAVAGANGAGLTGAGEEAEQIVNGVADLPLVTIAAVKGDHSQHVDQAIREAQRVHLPSNSPPMFRLYHIGNPAATQTTLILAGSHLIFDKQAVEIFWRELATLYDGSHFQLKTVDYCANMRRQVRRYAESRQENIAFWRAELAAAPADLRLPFSGQARRGDSHAGHTATRPLDRHVVDALTAIAHEIKATTSDLLLTIFAGVLASWSGDDEVTVGIPVDARTDISEANTIGFYTETLPIRVSTAQDADLANLCEQTHYRIAAAMAHINVTFDDIIRELKISRTPLRNPVFQAWFNDLSADRAELSFNGVTAAFRRIDDPPSLFDVALYVHPAAHGGVDLAVTCAAELFSQRVAEELATSVATAAARAGAGLRQPLGAVLPAGDLPAMAGPRGEPASAPGEAGDAAALAERFRATVRARGQRIAIVHAGNELSYADIAAQADAALRLLDGHGISPGQPVAALAEATPQLAAMILAAWEARVPVLLLDGRLPAAVRQAAVQTSGVAHIVATGQPQLTLTHQRSADRDEPGERPAGYIRNQGFGSFAGISHLLATSGTTGIPKLVAIPGDAFASALMEYAGEIGADADDRFVTLAGPGHDPVFRDLALPLVLGAVTGIPDPPTAADPNALLHYLRDFQPTILHLTPARAALLAAAAESAGISIRGVRAVVVGGDMLSWTLVRSVADTFREAVVYNAYGTTEVPQIASLRPCSRDDPTAGRPAGVPLGAGMGKRALVVLRHGQPAATGQLGELAILEEAPLARLAGGPVPHHELPGSRHAVRTGDLGRVNLDGEIDWCGRMDRQVSVAGHRVELDEVARHILAASWVSEAVVAPDSATGELTGLRAYVVAAAARPGMSGEQEQRQIRDLYDRLRASLAPWSVPESIRMVPRIVLDRNGKADVGATAALAADPPKPSLLPIDARLERVVRAHVPHGADNLTADTNFFDAGLDSLGVLRMHRDLRQEGFRELSITDLFRWPNLRSLSAGLRHEQQHSYPERSRAPLSDVAERRRQVRRMLNRGLELVWELGSGRSQRADGAIGPVNPVPMAPTGRYAGVPLAPIIGVASAPPPARTLHFSHVPTDFSHGSAGQKPRISP